MTHQSLRLLPSGVLIALLLSACDSSEPKPTATDLAKADGQAAAIAPASPAVSSPAVAGKREFKAETIKVACGACVFDMKDAEGCPWAAEVDGKHFLMEGNLPSDDDHDSHGEHGMCNVAREAVITGTLAGGKLTVTHMDIKPMASGS